MGLTIQQMFDYMDGMNDDKPNLVIKANKDNEIIHFKIYAAHDKFYLDVFADESSEVNHREILDMEEREGFKVLVMKVLKDVNIEDIYIEWSPIGAYFF